MRIILFLGCLVLPLIPRHVPVSSEVPLVLHGIDVSHYQAQIDWELVARRTKPDFVFIKATEGSDFTDSLFCSNWDALRYHRLKRGAYHYFRAYGCGLEQAKHFLQTVEMMPGDILPVLDVETTDDMAPEVLRKEVRAWLQYVEFKLGAKPIIYTNQNFYEQYLAGIFDNYPLWIAKYSDESPELSNEKAWKFWQYSNSGCVFGINHEVDQNLFYGTPEHLNELCWEGPAPTIKNWHSVEP
ncbi:MAG: GH25 family lysozyme [Saprospiraceae bacterium]